MTDLIIRLNLREMGYAETRSFMYNCRCWKRGKVVIVSVHPIEMEWTNQDQSAMNKKFRGHLLLRGVNS